MKRITLQEWIRQHRAELDKCIAAMLRMDKNPRANDEERRQ